MDASWGTTTKANDRNNLFTWFTSTDLTAKDCSQIADALRTQLGPPIINDGTTNLGSSPDAPLQVQINYQWDLGNTRVSGTCFGMNSRNSLTGVEEGTNFLLNALYTSKALQPKLIPKFALRCSRQGQILGGKVSNLNELSFWVDLHNKRVTNEFDIVLSDLKSFSPDD
jgi:hypothetical protein